MSSASSQVTLKSPWRGFGGGIAQDANIISMRPAGAAGTCDSCASEILSLSEAQRER